ncbi:hypothetical protein GDO81_019430 [Engystomops pustulosus]|uniref:NADH:ubiquinone reductase (H(+)-translocating) n=1 Tax=Engystomops pustulosus TaxID=76066 RepID=A0AAV6ZFN3_ENGPU|nr:hypothetical protein GDO81_019430 [Engystomops pustulosus]
MERCGAIITMSGTTRLVLLIMSGSGLDNKFLFIFLYSWTFCGELILGGVIFTSTQNGFENKQKINPTLYLPDCKICNNR